MDPTKLYPDRPSVSIQYVSDRKPGQIVQLTGKISSLVYGEDALRCHLRDNFATVDMVVPYKRGRRPPFAEEDAMTVVSTIRSIGVRPEVICNKWLKIGFISII